MISRWIEFSRTTGLWVLLSHRWTSQSDALILVKRATAHQQRGSGSRNDICGERRVRLPGAARREQASQLQLDGLERSNAHAGRVVPSAKTHPSARFELIGFKHALGGG